MRLVVIICLAACLFVMQAETAFCKKTNQPVLVDPFDLGAGGANLTLASGAGTLLANPALLPYGGTFHRWVGLDTWLLTNKEAVDTVLDAVQGGMNGAGNNSAANGEETPGEEATGGESSGEEGEGEGDNANTEFIDKVFATPLHFGWGTALSYYTNNGGLAVLSRFEPDIRARKRGSTGVPEISLRGESYHGAVGAVAARSPWRWLSFGLAAKYLYVSEAELDIEVTDQSAIEELQDPGFIRDLTEHGTGIGFDAGMLIFSQTRYFDWRLAGKVDDIGGTTFSGEGLPRRFEQVVSAGTSITFHTGSDAIHLAADYRDILGAYDEELFKKMYAGAKVLIRTYVGVSAGVYHGYPSYGAEIDLLLLRVAGTYYTRELGDHPGVDPRGIYIVSVAAGI